MQIAGQTFLVSGGSSGLGRACALHLTALGGRVAILDLNEHAASSVLTKFYRADVCQESDVAAAIQAAERELGPLRGVVTCAGVLGGARVVGRDGPHDLAQFERVIRVNLVGTFNVVRLAAAAMSVHEPLADGERGVIVMTASIAAFDGQVGQAAYAASKGGVASMTLPIARELAKLGMRAVSIAPGVFATPMILSLPDEQQAALTAPIPFPRRFGNPEEFANLVEQILTNRMLNGTTIRLDGGLRMPPK